MTRRSIDEFLDEHAAVIGSYTTEQSERPIDLIRARELSAIADFIERVNAEAQELRKASYLGDAYCVAAAYLKLSARYV